MNINPSDFRVEVPRLIPPEVVIAVAFWGRARGHGWMTMPPARNAVAGDKNGLGTR